MELLFLNIAEWLGVRQFKKLWIVGGSYWNKTHMDPQNKRDLLNVIDNTYMHTRNHILIILFEIFTAFFLPPSIPYLIITTLFHSYAFMIQLYNYILANKALQKTK